jgi:hypothetical protein
MSLRIDEIEANADPKYGRKGQKYAFYAARCCWWTTDYRDLGSIDGTPDGLPCCPYCGSVLYEAPLEGFLETAKENPGHYGPRGLDALADAHHGTGLHERDFPSYDPHKAERDEMRALLRYWRPLIREALGLNPEERATLDRLIGKER